MSQNLRYLFKQICPPVFTKLIQECRRAAFEKETSYNVNEADRLVETPFGAFEFIQRRALDSLIKTIFIEKAYEFKTQNLRPRILDCGANIGVTVRYWKHLYPDASVIAFEPDPEIFQILKNNVRSFPGIELVQAAVWSSEGEISFICEGREGGRIEEVSTNQTDYTTKTLPTKRLRDYLNEPIDLLKIDIEGAELAVLEDCVDRLHNVQHLFVEHHSFLNQPQQLGRFFTLLEEAGFRLHIHSHSNSPQPFIEKIAFNDKDLWLNIYCTRSD